MSIGTLTDIIVGATAIIAIILSIRNARAQKEYEANQERRWQREREPSLSVEMDSRSVTKSYIRLYSCRIVNDGYVPVEIRTLRIILDDGRTFPMPELHEDLVPELWENEQPITKPAVPTVLQPGQSIRYATLKDRVKTILQNAGFSGFTNFSVAVVDALDNHFTAGDSLSAGYSDPEP